MPNDKRSRILQAATRVFADKGFVRAGTKEIADAAGVGEGTLYHYFRGKDALLITIFVEVWSRQICELRARIAAREHPDEQMAAVIDSSLGLFEHNRALARIFLVELRRSPAMYSERPMQLLDETLALLRDIIESGRRRGDYRGDTDLRIVPMLLYGAAEGILTLWLLRDKSNADHYSLAEAKAVLLDSYRRLVRPC